MTLQEDVVIYTFSVITNPN